MRIAIALSILAAASGSAFAQDTPAVSPDQEMGKRFEIRAADLPDPYADEAVRNPPKIIERGQSGPAAPDGFTVTLFAENLKNPRKLLVLKSGDVLLAEQTPGYVTFLRDGDGDGKAEIVSRFAEGFKHPFGMAVVPTGRHAGDILVADARGIWRVPFKEGGVRPDMEELGKVDASVDGPTTPGDHIAVTGEGVFGPIVGHNTRSLAVDPGSGEMYVGVGSMGNIAEEPLPKASVQRFAPDGQAQTTFAAGTRNPIGLHFHPETGDLWAVVQERDGLGSRLAPDYMTRLSEGDFYGWPYTYAGGKPQPGFIERASADRRTAKMPDLFFAAHSAAMDFAFVPDSWPAGWRGDAIVALKGSWNRADPTGYKLVRAKFEGGRPAGWYENFVTGFWTAGANRANVWGRPASLAFLPDGGLLVADDTGGTIWKIAPAEPATGTAK